MCHRCEHGPAVEAGVYRGVAFDKTPCARCELRDQTAYVVPFDEERGGTGETAGEDGAGLPRPAVLPLAERSTFDTPFAEEGGDEPAVPISVMADLVLRLLTMPPRTRDVICWRFAGRSYREIGRALGVTMAAAELRHRRALAKWPTLRVLFSEKSSKQVRRKKAAGCAMHGTGELGRPDGV